VFVVEATAPAAALPTPRVSPPPTLQFTGRDPGTHPALHICSSTRPAPLLPLRRPLLRLRANFGARAGGGSAPCSGGSISYQRSSSSAHFFAFTGARARARAIVLLRFR
jgi:hypothetical protein